MKKTAPAQGKKKKEQRAASRTVKKTSAPKHTKPVKPFICLMGDEQLCTAFRSLLPEDAFGIAAANTLSSASKHVMIAFELTVENSEQKKKNLQILDQTLGDQVPIVTNALTATVLDQSQSIRHAERLIGISILNSLQENSVIELAPSLYTSKQTSDTVQKFFESLKKTPHLVQDSVGLVMPRILCQIINEAMLAVQNDVATGADVDDAMKLGTNYPHGPIAWGELIGFRNIVSILDALFHHHHEERYRVAPLLRQMAIAGTFWKTQETTS